MVAPDIAPGDFDGLGVEIHTETVMGSEHAGGDGYHATTCAEVEHVPVLALVFFFFGDINEETEAGGGGGMITCAKCHIGWDLDDVSPREFVLKFLAGVIVPGSGDDD